MNNIYHVIKDPVHGTMQFTSEEDAWVKPFIDSPHYQRLRHIKQMGMGDFIFPGAVHTRFNHCMGCCYVGSQIAHKIRLSDEERQLVMIACLLHDIGHGPFSHAFEGIFYNKCIRHEAWTPYFLNDFKTSDFFQHYNRTNSKHPLNEEKFNEIANMIMHKPVKRRVLADIVSSQLDADRLDYLLRDSHFCGVQYGEFDSRWMLHCLAIVQSHDGERLGITHKGIGVVEHYLMARRLMIRNIYQLQKKLALENLVIQLFANVASSLEENNAYAQLRQSRLGQFLLAANQFNRDIKDVSNIDEHRRRFLETNYPVYKELCDYDVFAMIRQLAEVSDGHPATQIAARVQQRVLPKTMRINFTDLEKATHLLNEFKAKHQKDFQDWQLVLIESPHRSYSSGGDDPILVVNEHGEVNPIDKYSIMIDAISNKLEHIAFLSVDKMIADDKRVTELMKSIAKHPVPVDV
jgi:HD superfamily phosphohydrolase